MEPKLQKNWRIKMTESNTPNDELSFSTSSGTSPTKDSDWPDVVATENQSHPKTLHDWALEYQRRGWHIFPLLPNKKNPATPHGHLDATNNLEQIEKWWTKNPNYNIGISCGPSNLTVLDFDTEKAHEEYGGRLPATFTVKTLRGRHYYFAGKTRSTDLQVDGEVRSENCYVVGAGSTHPD